MSIYRCAGCGAVNRTPYEAAPSQACSRCRRLLDTSGRPQAVDAAALVSAIRSTPAPVLVDFALREAELSALERFARARAGEVVVLRVDPREEPAAAEAYGIGSTQTLVLFSGGSEIARRAAPTAPDVGAWFEAARADAAFAAR